MVQLVLLFVDETWFFPAAMSRKLEGVHVGFLIKLVGQKAKRQREGTWRSASVAKVLKEAVTQTRGEYIEKG